MRFAVLGPLEVLQGDREPTTVPGAKERLLLGVLVAAAPAGVSTDRLLETLWAGEPPPTARKSLQAHVVRLRSALEPDRPRGSTGRYVVRRGPGYALSVERDAVDALAFGDLTTRGRARLAAGDPAGALEQLTAAVRLWRGEPYADWPDSPFADGERRRLTEVRSAAVGGVLEARLALGRHVEVVPELERLVAEEPLREAWWSLLMLALYRSGRQADALAAGRRARLLLADELGADPGPGLRTMEAAVLSQDPSLDVPRRRADEPGPPYEAEAPSPTVTVEGCPYKGLAAYQTADAALFHGRHRLVATLVRRLVDASLLVVSGPSGAGKSSVVRAGLVPALADGALPGSRAWRVLIVSPGQRPVDSLAALTGETAPAAPVLLVCDQFEQLWAPGNEEAERTAFLDTVLGLLADGVVARCVAVVRGDHLGRLAEHEAWADRLDGGIVLVPPMTDPELRSVVCRPARAAGLSVEPELLDVLVGDVLGQAGALPHLSTALVSTWERRQGKRLTVAGYLASGGVEGALARAAESAYAALDDRGQEVARHLTVRLADSDQSGALVRRAVLLAELDLDGAGGRDRRAVVDTFVGRRLFAVDGERLEVAHEALLTSWPRLARWLEDDAATRAVRRQVAPAALQWDRDGRPEDELYRGARLAPALDWAASAGQDLTPVERDFLEASGAHSDAELRAARQRVRRTRRLAVGLAAVLAVALVASGLALRYQRDADARAGEAVAATTIADANRLAVQSTTVGQLDVSLLLAAEANLLANTLESQDGLLAALIRHRRAVDVATLGRQAFDAALAGTGGVLFATFPGTGARVVAQQIRGRTPPRPVVDGWPDDIDGSPTEDLVAAAYMNEGPKLEVYRADGTKLLGQEGLSLGWPTDVAFSDDGRRLRVALGTSPGADGAHITVRELDLASRKWRTLGVVLETDHPFTEARSDFADDSSLVVAWTLERQPSAYLLDTREGTRTTLALTHRAAVSSDFVALPTGAAQLWDDGGMTLYDVGGHPVQTLDVHRASVRDVLVGNEGTWAASAGEDGTVVLWNIDPATRRWSPSETLTGHDGEIAALELDPTGQHLFSIGTDGRAITWDVTADAGFGSSYPGLGDRWIANKPELVGHDGLLVAPTRPVSSSLGGGGIEGNAAADTAGVAATFIDAATGRVVDEVPVGNTGQFPFGSSVSVSPDGHRVAVTSGNATTVLDTRTRDVLGRVELPSLGYVDPDGPIPELAWSAGWTRDGERLLIGAQNGLVVVDPSAMRPGRRVLSGVSVQAIESSPDGRLLAIGSSGGPEIWLLDPTTLDTVRTISASGSESTFDLSFSPDGRRLAVGGDAGSLRVLDTSSGSLLHPPVRIDSIFVQQVEWLPDGRTVVASGRSGSVALYDVRRAWSAPSPYPAPASPVRATPTSCPTRRVSSSCSAASEPATAIR